MKTNTLYVVPHPQQFDEAQVTLESFQTICREVLFTDPHTIIFLQMHGGIYPDGVTFHLPTDDLYRYQTLDSHHHLEATFDRDMALHIQKSLHDYERKTHLIEQSLLPDTVGLFLSQLNRIDENLKRIVVIGMSLEGSQRHYEYGSLIARALQSDTNSHTVIASGQLSHCLSPHSEAGFVEHAQDFDKMFVKTLEEGKFADFFHLDPFELEEVGQDLYRPLCAGMGMLGIHENEAKWETLSYESPHGIGYLTGKLSRFQKK